jgi:hypothetical protein
MALPKEKPRKPARSRRRHLDEDLNRCPAPSSTAPPWNRCPPAPFYPACADYSPARNRSQHPTSSIRVSNKSLPEPSSSRNPPNGPRRTGISRKSSHFGNTFPRRRKDGTSGWPGQFPTRPRRSDGEPTTEGTLLPSDPLSARPCLRNPLSAMNQRFMARALHIAVLSLGLVALILAMLARHTGPEPKLELLSYLALGGGLFELISIVRKGLNRATPSRFSAAMVILVFCIWTGGSAFTGSDALRNSGILLVTWIICCLASWGSIHRSNPDPTLRAKPRCTDSP